LGVVERFGEHRSCHHQGEYVLVGRVWLPYVGQEVGGALNVVELIGVCLSVESGWRENIS
jgi:hypothetical protein